MLKQLSMAIVAVALAGTANAAGWRSLRVDASSEAAFEQSLAEFKDELSPGRRYVLAETLKDIWVAGAEAADAEGRDYTVADYYRQLDGLDYEQLVTLLDPTGETARRYRAAYNPYFTGDRRAHRVRATSESPGPWAGAALSPQREPGPNWRGGTPLFGPTPPSQ